MLTWLLGQLDACGHFLFQYTVHWRTTGIADPDRDRNPVRNLSKGLLELAVESASLHAIKTGGVTEVIRRSSLLARHPDQGWIFTIALCASLCLRGERELCTQSHRNGGILLHATTNYIVSQEVFPWRSIPEVRGHPPPPSPEESVHWRFSQESSQAKSHSGTKGLLLEIIP